MPQFFIDRPIFAWVVAILISLGGVISILNLGVESYPSIAPPQVRVVAIYSGASANSLEKTVTQVIEQELTGIDNLLYFNSSSSASGRATINLTFESGTDPDIAQVQVQNKVSLASPRLPEEVVQQGIQVTKANPDFLMAVGMRSRDGSIDRDSINDYIAGNIIDQIARLPGVGEVRHFGSEFAMRIWLNPDKLKAYGLSAPEVLAAIRSQNVQFAAGTIGASPAVEGQGFTASVSAESRFTDAEQFKNIILRATSDGTNVRLQDVAKVGLGAESYGFDTQFNGQPTGAFAVTLQSGANALNVADVVRDKLTELEASFPASLEWFVPYDTTEFVKISIEEVVETLIIAIILVFIVMYLFLQDFRATIIPTLVIPVSLLGTFLGMLVLGFTINQLTLFGMVLAIGIVVDDAIVVIENVERVHVEDKLPMKQATRKAMGQITGAIVAISVVLAAVFIPSAMQGGSVGAIYRQFALTIAVSMGFSAFLALSFTPALCATLMKDTHDKKVNWFFRKFNQFFDWMTATYRGHIFSAVTHAPRWIILFVLMTILTGYTFIKLPSSFVPEEDQGYALVLLQLPEGATMARNQEAFRQIHEILQEDPAFDQLFQITGFSFVGSGENVGMGFIRLKNWSEREATATEFIQNSNMRFAQNIKNATVFMVNVPTISGLSQFGGFDMYLQDINGAGYEALSDARNMLLGKAQENPNVINVRPNAVPDTPQLQLNVDRNQAQSMGLSVSDVYSTIQLMLAPVYANDFFYQGRVKKVQIQADAPYRMGPEALNKFYAVSHNADVADDLDARMIPLANVVDASWFSGPPQRVRYNGYSAIEIVGDAAPGKSSGQAMQAMDDLVANELPTGFGSDWTGQSYQEIISGNTAPLLFALSLLVVFLCLAALYESWSIPVSVLLIVPLGVLGAVLFSMARGLPNDVYFKIGLITIIGLAAKNAILIVEFAVEEQAAGRSLRDAVVEGARLRLRPILMTSLAFILGVLPLAISTGAGANARHAIGTGVIGGMIFATFLGILFVPVFYTIVRRLLGDKLDAHAEGLGNLDDVEPFAEDSSGGSTLPPR